MDTFTSPASPELPPRQSLRIIYLISVVFVFHTLLTAYSSSTYLEQFTSTRGVSLLYAIGSALSILLFLYFTPLVRRFGNVRLTLLLMALCIGALLCLGLQFYPLISFVIFCALNPALYLVIDIYSESRIGEHDGHTGRARGLTLSLMAIASMLAPLVMGAIADNSLEHMPSVYFLSAAIGLAFMTIVAFAFRRFHDPDYPALRARDILMSLKGRRHLRGVIGAHFLLQFFFSWVVIFFPLYLATELNYSWSTIGSIIAAGLFAYVICEYPIGIVADRFSAERVLMAIGFVVLALSSASIGFTAVLGTVGFMVVMFLTRVGASLVEVGSESYFFKQVDSKDAALIGFFRLTRPAANLCGAAAGTLALLFLPFPLLFILLGCLMVPGIIFAGYVTYDIPAVAAHRVSEQAALSS